MKRFRWKEPLIFKQTAIREHKHRDRWFRPLFLLTIVALGLGGAAFHRKPIAGDWTLTAAVVLGVGWSIAYGVPMIAMRDPNIVFIGEHGIGRQINMAGGVQHELWPWEGIAHCRLETVERDGRAYRVLAVYSLNDERAEFPLNDRVDSSELEEAILANGGDLLRK
jgi:hypothetical protein